MTNANIPGWINLNTISIVFSKPVSGVAAAGLLLGDSGNNGGTSSGITVSGESNPSTTVAKFTLSGSLSSNKYYLDLAAAGITDAAGATLDGEWTTSVSTFAAGSGDGAPGGDFVFRFNVLAGDVNRDGGCLDGRRHRPAESAAGVVRHRELALRRQRRQQADHRRRDGHAFETPGGHQQLPGADPAQRE